MLTDGAVTLRPWAEGDIEAAVRGHDAEIGQWLGLNPGQPGREDLLEAVRRWREGYADGRRLVGFVVEYEGAAVGYVEVRRAEGRTGVLSWALFAGQRGRGLATRALALLADYAFTQLGLDRIEARVDADNHKSLRLATRAGMRREGLLRGAGLGAGRRDTVILARLVDDTPMHDPAGFRELLNAFLPRKRAIGQLLVRDGEGRVLLCNLTYKKDWDLPGGVVEVGESPRVAAARELQEELGFAVDPGPLLLTDWLPPWGGWDDALCLVFDGGTHPASLLDGMVADRREIRDARFCTLEQARELCADFTARRVAAALAALAAGPTYTESGR